MNVYVLDEDPVAAAIAQCDAHVVAGSFACAQLLRSAAEDLQVWAGELPQLYNTNCVHAEWATRNTKMCEWLLKHTLALQREYTHRYGRDHKLLSAVSSLEPRLSERLSDLVDLYDYGDDSVSFMAHAPYGYWPCNPVEASKDVVAAYRRYYIMEKRRGAKYTRRAPPPWMVSALEQPPTLPIQAARRTRPYLGIPVKIEARQVRVSLFDPHTYGMPSVDAEPLVVRFDGTCRDKRYTLGRGATRVLKELRNYG